LGLFDPGPELVVLIVLLALLLFGSKKLPELARGIGRALGEFKRGKMEIEREIASEFTEQGASPEETAKNKVVDAAKALGLPVEGRSEQELKSDISHAAGSEEDRLRIVQAAKALGIPVEGVGVDDLRKQISRTVSY
jgi:TatA/E family protein of Tat protein translocase